MITHIVFDVGRVLVGYHPDKIIDILTPGTPYKETYLAHLFYADLWHELDKGVVSHEEAVARLSHYVGHEDRYLEEIRRLLDGFSDHLDVIEGTRDIFLALHGRYPLYILSNFQDRPFDQLVARCGFFAKASGQVVSAKIKMMKPDADIYHYLLSTYDLPATSTLFIDDLPANIETAKSVGMQGIVFESPEQLVRDLAQFGIRV